MSKRILWALIVMNCLAISVEAAENRGETLASSYKMAEMIVTDTKSDQKQDTVTQKVDVVYSDDFAARTQPHRNLSEIMQYSSGQFVNPLSRNDANWGSFGGLGPKYNVYLLDGLPVDNFVDSMSLDSMAFDRAELYKGPASVMYPNYLSMDFSGNEAPLAGVTNFITKDVVDKAATNLRVSAGSYNTVGTSFYHQDVKGNLSLFFGGSYEKSDYTDYGTEDSWLHILDDPDYQKTKLYMKGTYLLGRDDHKVSIFINHTEHTGDAGRANRDFDHTYDTINFSYSNQINDRFKVQFKSGLRDYDRNWSEDNYPASLSLSSKGRVRQRILPSDLSLSLRHSDEGLLTFGADHQYATYRTYTETNGVSLKGNDVAATQVGVYVQDKVIVDKWVLRAGARQNYTNLDYDLVSGVKPSRDSKSWNKTIYSGGVRFNASDSFAVYANAGNSYVVPSAKAVGGTLNASDLGVAGKNGQLPNPDLKPEKGLSGDLGIEVRPSKSLKLGLRGFVNQVDDAIVDNVVSRTPSQTRSVNAGKAESQGIEVSIEHAAFETLGWFANLTYTSTRIDNDLDPDQDGADISFVPRNVFNFGVNAKLPFEIEISPYYNVVDRYYDSTSKSGRQKFGPYGTVNVHIQKTITNKGNYDVTAGLDLNNLTDRKYKMPWQFQDPGFNIQGSIEVRF